LRQLTTILSWSAQTVSLSLGGDVDYMLKVIVADIAGYDRVYKQLIRTPVGSLPIAVRRRMRSGYRDR
jgi:hypothetical protein